MIKQTHYIIPETKGAMSCVALSTRRVHLNRPLSRSSLNRSKACVQVLNSIGSHNSWTDDVTPQR
jgi:hypothetical protein